MEDWRDPEAPEKNPNALSYGISSSAPASIKPVDIETWKTTVEPTFRNYFTEEYNSLIRQYEELVKKYHVNKLVYESQIGFKPAIGHIYHLYQRSNGTRFLSLVSPETTSWHHIGSYRMTSQYSWEQIDG